MNKKIVNIDWLQINVHSKSGDQLCFAPQYEIKRLEGATRHFSIIEEVYIKDQRICTLARVPLSKIIPAKTILLKFDNQVLYQENLYQYVQHFLTVNMLEFKSISRLDIACDFLEFDNGQAPSEFISDFINCRILKKRKSKFSIHGTHGTSNVIDYLKFGTANSSINYYLYNKTKELEQVKNKPHIRDTWAANGITNETVWRLEFSIKSATKDVVDTETGEVFQLKDLSVLKRLNMVDIYQMLLNHYFVFYVNDGQVIKSRMKQVHLFDAIPTTFNMIPKTKKKDSSRSDKIFIKKLNSLNDELRHRSQEFNSVITEHLISEYVFTRGLVKWALSKGFLPNNHQTTKHKYEIF